MPRTIVSVSGNKKFYVSGLPDYVYYSILAVAKAEDRSINAQLRAALIEWLEKAYPNLLEDMWDAVEKGESWEEVEVITQSRLVDGYKRDYARRDAPSYSSTSASFAPPAPSKRGRGESVSGKVIVPLSPPSTPESRERAANWREKRKAYFAEKNRVEAQAKVVGWLDHFEFQRKYRTYDGHLDAPEFLRRAERGEAFDAPLTEEEERLRAEAQEAFDAAMRSGDD